VCGGKGRKTAATSKSYPVCPVQVALAKLPHAESAPGRRSPTQKRGPKIQAQLRGCRVAAARTVVWRQSTGVRTGLKGLRVRERYRCRRAASIACGEGASPRHDRRMGPPTPKSRACMRNADSKGGSSLSERRARPLDSPVRPRCDRDPRPDLGLRIYDSMGGSEVPA